MPASKRALIVVDLQNDYFPEGQLPLWNTAATLERIEAAIARANALAIPVILVQHLADTSKGPAPFFSAGTPGAQIHPRILAAAPSATIVTKACADAFVDTELEATLQAMGVTELLVCGMMTQNCVTHTAISRSADKYKVAILADCCTSVSQLIHAIALRAVATRMTLLDSCAAL